MRRGTRQYQTKRKYRHIDDSKRQKLIQLFTSKDITITRAANKLAIPYENAKAILRTFRKQGRMFKKKNTDTISGQEMREGSLNQDESNLNCQSLTVPTRTNSHLTTAAKD